MRDQCRNARPISRTAIAAAFAGALALAGPTLAQSDGAASPAPRPDTVAPAQAAAPRLAYLGRFYAPLNAPSQTSDALLIFHPRPGGWFSGPRLTGALIDPAGDWVRTLPSGDMRIDVRISVRLDDGSPLYVSYQGVLAKPAAESWRRFLAGERIDAPAWHYVVAPTFETRSERYAWLNRVQAIGKFVSIQTGEGAHVAFDFYAVD